MNSRLITIDHFIIKSLEPFQFGSENFYPVGIRINYSNNKFELKSRINEHLKIYRSDLERITKGEKELSNILVSGYFSEDFFSEIISQKRYPIYHLLEDEKQVLKKIVELKNDKFLQKLTKEKLNKAYQNYTLEISDIIDQHIKSGYLQELRGLFLQSIDKEEEKEFFHLVNYFVHFINWDNSFYNFYDSSYDVLPGHLRKVENRLSSGLRKSIKAYLAFHDHVNVLKRLLEKREKGRISTLSLLDWHTDIKAILTKQFITFFGKKKTDEYIGILEGILQEETN